MIYENLVIISGSANANLVCTNLSYAERITLMDLEPGEIVYQYNNYGADTAGLYIYNGSIWIQLGLKGDGETAILADYKITDAYTVADINTLLATKLTLVDGKVPEEVLPDSILGQLTYQGTYNMAVDLPPASASNKGEFYIANNITVQRGYYTGDWAISNGTTWERIANSGIVSSVNNRTGAIVITKADLELGNVDNTSDLSKPVSVATANAISLKLDTAGGVLTGMLTTSSTIGGATNIELSYLSGVTSSIQTQLNGKLNINNPTVTGTLTAPTISSTQITCNTISDLAGSLRKIPQNLQTSTYTAVLTDVGKHISTPTGVTIPANVFSTGDTFIIFNNSILPQIVSCSTVTAYASGNTSVRTSVTVSAKGLCTVLFTGANEILLAGDVA
jgi:hypothetical protein